LYTCPALSIDAFKFSLCLFRAWYRSQLRQTTEALRALPQSGLKSHAKPPSFSDRLASMSIMVDASD